MQYHFRLLKVIDSDGMSKNCFFYKSHQLHFKKVNVKFKQMKIKSILFLIAMFLMCEKIFSQSTEIKFVLPNSKYLKSFFSDTKQSIGKPLHWNLSQTVSAAVSLQTTLMLFDQDKNIQQWVQQHRNSTTNNLSNALKPFGNGLVLEGGCAALYAGGLILNKPAIKNYALQGVKVIALNSVVVGAAKILTGRPRPYQSNNPLAWAGPFQNSENRSFFSGHATFSFSMATTLNYYNKKKFWDVMAYAVATGVALSRVNNYDHWSSDVFFGACFGTAFTWSLLNAKN